MKHRVFRLTDRTVAQFLKYLVGGGVYFWSGLAVFAFLYSWAGWNWLYAKIAADVIGWFLNYLIQRFWAFNSRKLAHHESSTIGKFAIITTFNLLLDYAIIGGLKVIGISPYFGFFISATFFTIWNYLWYRFWVFYRQGNTARKAVV